MRTGIVELRRGIIERGFCGRELRAGVVDLGLALVDLLIELGSHDRETSA